MAGAGLLTILTVWSAPADAAWSGATHIPYAVSTGEGLGFASYNGDLYSAWLSHSSPYDIYYSTSSNGTKWAKPKRLSKAVSNFAAGVSLAVYGGDLYAAWIGNSSPYHIWYSSFNGTSWAKDTEVPIALTTEYNELGLASFNGALWLSWVGQSSPYAIYYSALTSTGWSTPTNLPESSALGYYSTGPALASYEGYLVASWASSEGIEYSLYGLTGWTLPSLTPFSTGLSTGPSLAVYDGALYWAWTRGGESGVSYADLDVTTWSGVSAIPASVGVNAYSPAIAAYGSSLYAEWLNSAMKVYYASGP